MKPTNHDAKRTKRFPCMEEGCEKWYATSAGLDAHIAAKHSPEPLHACRHDECTFVGLCRATLETHWTTVHMKKKDFQCVKCKKRYVTKAVLQKHNDEVHNKPSTAYFEGEERVYCPMPKCAKDYAHKSALEEHIKTVHLGERVPCPECDKDFAHLSSMKSHLRRHDAPGERFTCPTCAKEFKSKGGLRNHHKFYHGVRISAGLKPGTFGVTFAQKSDVKARVRRHWKSTHSKKVSKSRNEIYNRTNNRPGTVEGPRH